MKLIKPDVVVINEKDPFKKMELAGRTCYKSENRITEDSAKKFCGMLIKNKHLAMAEHAIFCFVKISGTDDLQYLTEAFGLYKNAQFTVTNLGNYKYRFIFTANLRVLIENNLIMFDKDWNIIELYPVKYYGFKEVDFESYVKDKTDEEIAVHRYTTMRFTTDRGVTHELVRHRKCSFAQESTRYVKYNQCNMQFIEPAEYENWAPDLKGYFLNACVSAEDNYCRMMEHGAIAQQARAVLPNAVKTELIITTYDEEWKHMFELRCDKAAQPDCRNIMIKAQELYNEIYDG